MTLDRRVKAKEFLALNQDWFTIESNSFYGLIEIAERLLEEWTDTGIFPEVHGIWIYFESKFMEFICL